MLPSTVGEHVPGKAHTTLTEAAVKEMEELLKFSRRSLSSFYRSYSSGLTLEEIARSRGALDLRKVKEELNALRVLFGREPLPKRGAGRQQAIYEAEYWLHSDRFLSEEVTEHFEKLLKLAEKTNTRRKDSYEAPLPPKTYSMKDRPRGEQDYPAVYILTSQRFLEQTSESGTTMKIGWSQKVWDRVASAQTWDPEPVKLLRLFPCIDPQLMEAKFHIVLDTLSLGIGEGGGKEWFHARLELIDEVARGLELYDAASPEEGK
jgi:hypothetical protein